MTSFLMKPFHNRTELEYLLPISDMTPESHLLPDSVRLRARVFPGALQVSIFVYQIPIAMYDICAPVGGGTPTLASRGGLMNVMKRLFSFGRLSALTPHL